MSEVAADTRDQRSWLLTWLAGAVVAMLAGLAVMTATLPCGCGRRGDLVPLSQYLNFALDALEPAAVIAFPTALLLIAIMIWAERRRARRLAGWLIGGLIATSPIALIALAFMLSLRHGPVRPPTDAETATVLAFFYACGLVGAVTAFRVRRGSWRA